MEDDENRKMLLQEYQQDYIEREPREEHTDLVKLRAIYDSKIYDVKHFTNDKAKQRRYGTWGNCMESYIINNNSGGSHEYKKARTFVDKDIFGRDYSAHSVQILPGDIRRSITEDYDDLDINASHDTSIDVVCRMCDVETPPIIKEYIKNKDPTRKRISKETNLSVKEVKLIINKLKYGEAASMVKVVPCSSTTKRMPVLVCGPVQLIAVVSSVASYQIGHEIGLGYL